MAGSYGAETTQGGRYRLSFTVGGLLSPQGRAFAEMYLNRMGGGSTERSSQTKISEKISEKANEKSDKNAGEEVCESIAAIRQQAIEENVLAIRTDSANRRVVAETTRRLSALTVGGAFIFGRPGFLHIRPRGTYVDRDVPLLRNRRGIRRRST